MCFDEQLTHNPSCSWHSLYLSFCSWQQHFWDTLLHSQACLQLLSNPCKVWINLILPFYLWLSSCDIFRLFARKMLVYLSARSSTSPDRVFKLSNGIVFIFLYFAFSSSKSFLVKKEYNTSDALISGILKSFISELFFF